MLSSAEAVVRLIRFPFKGTGQLFNFIFIDIHGSIALMICRDLMGLARFGLLVPFCTQGCLLLLGNLFGEGYLFVALADTLADGCILF